MSEISRPRYEDESRVTSKPAEKEHGHEWPYGDGRWLFNIHVQLSRCMAAASALVLPMTSDYHRIISPSLRIPSDSSIAIPVGLLACQRISVEYPRHCLSLGSPSFSSR
jgi:hypothetical protein